MEHIRRTEKAVTKAIVESARPRKPKTLDELIGGKGHKSNPKQSFGGHLSREGRIKPVPHALSAKAWLRNN
jgi:hypothetical protein